MKFFNLTRKALLSGAALLLASSVSYGANLKYIFYFIGDGMGSAEVTNAQLFNKKVLGNDEPLLMTTFPVVSLITTHSASSDVTDSAAAGTALSTGHKTKNGMLGMNADTVAVTSIARTLFENGYGVGLVTTVAIDDATPGAFYTHVPHRSMFYEIGKDLAESGYQFAAGASLRGTKDKDGNDNGLMDLFKKNNVAVSYGLDGIDKKAKKQLVLSPFHDKMSNEVGLAVDSLENALTLPEMTQACLDHLMRTNPKKFFMMVEGGSIDHNGHSNDGGASVREVKNFDNALKIAYDFYLKHPNETLILVTADHETGGMSVGCDATGYSARPEVARAQRISKDKFNEYCYELVKEGKTPSWDEMEAFLAEKLGFGTAVKLTDSELNDLRDSYAIAFMKKKPWEFVDQAFSILNSKSGFGWTTGDHTGHPVPVYVIGVGANKFTNFNDNTDLPKKILKLAGK